VVLQAPIKTFTIEAKIALSKNVLVSNFLNSNACLSDKLLPFSRMERAKAKLHHGRKNHDQLMRINTNISALQAQRSMSEHSRTVESASGKLAQGTRVRNASDDAASLAIGTKQKSNIKSNYQAMRNASDAISEFQMAEGTLNEVGNMLVRLKELSVQAASEHLVDEDRANINYEYMALRSEIERTTQSANFLGDNLFRSTKDRTYQIGLHNDETSKMELDRAKMIVTEFSLQIVDSSIPTAEEARLNLGYIDTGIERLAKTRAALGAIQNRMQSTVNNLDTSRLNESAAMSQRMDADFAHETSEKIRGELRVQAASSVMVQANNVSANALKLLKDS
jgi:flagellin